MEGLKKVILLVETSREFGRELLYGIARYSKLHGPWSFYREPRGLRSSVPRLEQWGAHGIIMRNSGIRGALLSLKIPAILAIHDSTRPAFLPAIVTDPTSIANLAGQHLLSRGLRHVAYCGFPHIIWSNERLQEFEKFMAGAGLKPHVYTAVSSSGGRTWYSERSQMREWVRRLPKPIGIMACNDDRGQHVLEVCKELDIRVPDAVAVIGVDNDTMVCELADPPLTSIALNAEPAGYAAAQLLDCLMRGEPMRGQEIVVQATHVVPRQSTDLLAVDDQNVAEAIRFIRQNARSKLRVNDVVAHSHLSRRGLEYHFRNTIHRTIQEEIRRTRVELIATLLAGSDMPVAEVADRFSFTDVEHISRYFRREKNMGLREYRRLIRGT